MELSGINKYTETQDKLRSINNILSKITHQFSNNASVSKANWEKFIIKPSLLQGISKNCMKSMHELAVHNNHCNTNENGWLLTLDPNTVSEVLRSCKVESTRKLIYEASIHVATEKDHNNTILIPQILKLRKEKAELLGFSNLADYNNKDNILSSYNSSYNFLNTLKEKSLPLFKKEEEEFKEFINENASSLENQFNPWSVSYWYNKLKETKFNFSVQEVSEYFEYNNTLMQILSIFSKYFNIQIEKKEVPTWHKDVSFYEIYDKNIHIGSFYIDPFARPSKNAGAWHNSLHSGERPCSISQTYHTPHTSTIVCNFSRPTESEPSLLNFMDVTTLFHEFGHCLHGIFGNVPDPDYNGTRVAIDFVELPSQLLENWCWVPEIMTTLSKHYKTGEQLPDHIKTNMINSRFFAEASSTIKQLRYGIVDLGLHNLSLNELETINSAESLYKLYKDLVGDLYYSFPKDMLSIHTGLETFSHIFSSPVGYACNYYSYKWSEVLEADVFEFILTQGLENKEVASKLKTEILSKGSSETPAILYRNFMSRDPDMTAFTKRLLK